MTTESNINYVYLMMLKTTNTWLQIPLKERFEFLNKTIVPIVKQHPSVKMRFFDSEAFSARFTDFVMWETSNISKTRSK